MPAKSKQYIQKRKYGPPYKGKDFGLTVQSLIVGGDKPLVAFLGLELDYWRKKIKKWKRGNKKREEMELPANVYWSYLTNALEHYWIEDWDN